MLSSGYEDPFIAVNRRMSNAQREGMKNLSVPKASTESDTASAKVGYLDSYKSLSTINLQLQNVWAHKDAADSTLSSILIGVVEKINSVAASLATLNLTLVPAPDISKLLVQLDLSQKNKNKYVTGKDEPIFIKNDMVYKSFLEAATSLIDVAKQINIHQDDVVPKPLDEKDDDDAGKEMEAEESSDDDDEVAATRSAAISAKGPMSGEDEDASESADTADKAHWTALRKAADNASMESLSGDSVSDDDSSDDESVEPETSHTGSKSPRSPALARFLPSGAPGRVSSGAAEEIPIVVRNKDGTERKKNKNGEYRKTPSRTNK